MVFAFFAPDQDSSLPCHLIVRDIVNPVVTPGPRKPQKQIIAASLNITSPISSDLPVTDTGLPCSERVFTWHRGLEHLEPGRRVTQLAEAGRVPRAKALGVIHPVACSLMNTNIHHAIRPILSYLQVPQYSV